MKTYKFTFTGSNEGTVEDPEFFKVYRDEIERNITKAIHKITSKPIPNQYDFIFTESLELELSEKNIGLITLYLFIATHNRIEYAKGALEFTQETKDTYKMELTITPIEPEEQENVII